MTKRRAVIRVFGIVQGVGFRPFIHKIVKNYGFKGWVQNSTSGVTIDIEGEESDLKEFVSDITDKAPSLAVIEEVKIIFDNLKEYTDFKIVKSDCDEEGFVLVSPDVSICDDCYNELIDPSNMRYRYPLINCTNCGPRFTIIKDLPYDREKTTMDEFYMCTACDKEYHDIENRRYHAQPNCCPECGPQVQLIDKYGNLVQGDPIGNAVNLIAEGKILAIKGLGGFHLVCDGLNRDAIKTLRIRKQREAKPFALMCNDINSMRKYVYISGEEQKVLEGIRKPILLLNKKENCIIPREVSPDNNSIGFMLPYTPIHFLLFADGTLDVVVMTSANISDNPIIYTNKDAVEGLQYIADYLLIHNRDINTRCDDSVLRIVKGKEYFIRRSRGYAPFPLKLKDELKPILACGAEQKASFSMSKGRYVFLSQHIGDLKNYETFKHYDEQIKNYKKLFNIEPTIAVCDLHPDYLSTNYAEKEYKTDVIYVQHHHAHMASCMADNNLYEDVIGITWDGTGLGIDGSIWGGEILIGGYSGFKRVGTLMTTPMPGGDKAVKNISYMGLSYLIKTYGIDYLNRLELLKSIKDSDINFELLYSIIEKGINSPDTSSCGRLFDGVSSIIGLSNTALYEGQGAIKLESLSKFEIEDKLSFDIHKHNDVYIYDWRSTINDILNLIQAGKDNAYIASAFHNTLVEAAVKQCCYIRDDTGLNKIALSGGVFQNNYLLKKMIIALNKNDFKAYIHNRVSANDEGISLGQLMIAQYGGGVNVSGSTT